MTTNGGVIPPSSLFGVGCSRESFDIVVDVIQERTAQKIKWGLQNHPDMNPARVVNGHSRFEDMAFAHKADNDQAAEDGTIDWTGILLEEVYEALAESDPVRLRTELIQSAAVIVAWVEDIDRRAL